MAAEGMKKRVVLIVGGSGYLGLHLLEALLALESECYTLAYTYNAHRRPVAAVERVSGVAAAAFRLDLRSGDGLEEIKSSLGTPDVVINCAAISVPRACEQDPEAAAAINVPSVLVQWLKSLEDAAPFLVHLSTDQVYEGVKSFYKETDETHPVNTYGATKVAAEKLIQSSYTNYAILRSSIIVGPQPSIPLPKTLPLQWMDGVLASGEGADFFQDEYRCPVFVKDVVQVIQLLMRKASESPSMQVVMNVGGPERLSRAAMAETVASVRGYDTALVRKISSKTAANRGVVSPADISMDVSKVGADLNFKLTDFATVIALTFK